MAILFKLNQISIAMELQDETDKQSVFLMGNEQVDAQTSAKLPLNYFMKDNKNSVIGLDSSCLSCSNAQNN